MLQFEYVVDIPWALYDRISHFTSYNAKTLSTMLAIKANPSVQHAINCRPVIIPGAEIKEIETRKLRSSATYRLDHGARSREACFNRTWFAQNPGLRTSKLPMQWAGSVDKKRIGTVTYKRNLRDSGGRNKWAAACCRRSDFLYVQTHGHTTHLSFAVAVVC